MSPTPKVETSQTMEWTILPVPVQQALCQVSHRYWSDSCAEPSHLARKHKVKTNPPPISMKRSQRARSSTYTPKPITPHHRVKDFFNEGPVVSGGKLLCSACREEIGLKVPGYSSASSIKQACHWKRTAQEKESPGR